MLRRLLIRSYPFSIGTSVSYSTTRTSGKVPVCLPGSIKAGSVIRERYRLLHRIGSGGSSTVWLVWDQQQSRYVSLKMKPKGRPAPPCQCPDEATFLRLVPNADGQMHPGHTILPQLFDNFTLEADDTTGFRGYECIVTNVLGQSVQTLSCENRISLPWDTMKQVVFSILLGLDYLHSVKGVLHGDLKPDNILLGLPDNPDKVIEKFLASLDSSQDTSGPITITRPNTDMLDIRLTDLDLGELFSDIFTRHHSFQIQPRALCAPEVILGSTWGLPADIWNLGCLTYEMATSRYLYLQGPEPSDDFDQLSCMVKFLGDFPPGLIAASSPISLKYFEPDGRFKRSIERVPFEALVVFTLTQAEDRPTGLNLSTEELALFIDFLRETMCLEADKRGTALELLNHPWLDDMAKRYISKVEEEQGIVADGEI